MRNKTLLLVLPLALFLALFLRPLPLPAAEPPHGPAVQLIPPSAEQAEREPEEAPSFPTEVHVIEGCTVTWYTADTCGKAPDHPAYGITASGLLVEEGVTCAVDPEVIPLFSEVSVLYADGTVEQFRATIHMPKEAARIFLRVTDVRVERLQDITEEQAKAEGACKAYPYTDPTTGKTEYVQDKLGTYRGGFSCVWDSAIKPADRALYGWEANPWVWVIAFKRIRKDEIANA